MPGRGRGSILQSLVGILVCGAAGALAAWGLVTAAGLEGVAAGIVAAVLGMVAATALWAVGVALLRAWGWIR